MGLMASRVLAGTWRDLHTGVNPKFSHPLDADGALDEAGDPGVPVDTRIEGGSAMVLPWFDALEDPFAPNDLPFPDVSGTAYHDSQTTGAKAIPTAYEGAVRTRGPVYQWGHEAAGGLEGDQAIGRIMRFPANIPERYDANGVRQASYADELAAAIANNGQGIITENQVTAELLTYPGVI